MHKFAYYLCYKCKQPYFGGHRSCEVAAGVGEERVSSHPLALPLILFLSRLLLPLLPPPPHLSPLILHSINENSSNSTSERKSAGDAQLWEQPHAQSMEPKRSSTSARSARDPAPLPYFYPFLLPPPSPSPLSILTPKLAVLLLRRLLVLLGHNTLL